jgi:hypothetical protein
MRIIILRHVLYGNEISFPTLRKGHRQRAFEIWEQRRIFETHGNKLAAQVSVIAPYKATASAVVMFHPSD